MTRTTRATTVGTARGLALLMVLGAAGAAAQERPIQFVIASGKVAEVCMPLNAGDRLHWRFEASGALDFNLHHHVGPQVLMPVEQKAVQRGRGEQGIDQGNEWCLMWQAAPGAATPISVEGAWSVRPAAAPT